MVNTVSFPGLGIELELNRVAFNLFGKDIYWYGIIIAAGFLLAVWFCFRFIAPKFNYDADKLMDALFPTVPAAIIGARIYYVIFYLDLYKNEDGSFNWGSAIAIWDGGLAIYGGIIGALLAAIIYCLIRKQPFWAFVDTASFGFLIGQMIGRWGNFFNVEAYGGVTDVAWRMTSPSIANELFWNGIVDYNGYQEIIDGTLGVHPTFLYESLWNLIGLVVLIFIFHKLRKFDGQIFLSYVIWYGVGRTMIEGLRTDSLYLFQTGLRVSQLVGIISALAAVILMFVLRKRNGMSSPDVKSEEESEEDGSGTN